jgi:hypothetical protein
MDTGPQLPPVLNASLGDTVNVLLDDLDALLMRLGQFPLILQWGLWMLVFALLGALLLRLFSRADRPGRRTLIKTGIAVAACTALLVVLDHRLGALESSLEELRMPAMLPGSPAGKGDEVPQRGQGEVLTVTGNVKGADMQPASDPRADRRRATPGTTGVRLRASGTVLEEDGMRIERIEFEEPNATCFLATIELAWWTPVLDPDITVKERTSTFCQRFGLTFGVNGEAGTSPGMDAPLGKWKGLYVVDGRTLLAGDDRVRPFIHFDTEGRCGYSPGNEVHTRPDDAMHNVIWGRWDLLVDGAVAIPRGDGTSDHHYPRTILGTDRLGSTLFVLIVDGRRAQYSRGMTMAQCADLLLQRGVYEAMACDQGGSCTMYHQRLGVVNRPSDGGERPVYTHLGLKPRG